MKNNSQAKNNNGNMSTKTKTVKKNTNSVTTQVSEWVLNTLSNSLSTDQVTIARTSIESKQGELQNILNKQTTKKIKDVNAPKRGKSSYIFFCMDSREKIQTKNPDMSAKDIIKELGNAWRTLNDTQKEKYVKLAENDKKRYTGEISDYTPPANFLSKKKVKSSGPKRGLSAYIFFCNEQRNPVKEKNPTLSNKELTSELGKRWNLLTDEQKKPYNTLAATDKTRYESEKNSQTTTSTETKASKVTKTSKTVESKPTTVSSTKKESKTTKAPKNTTTKDTTTKDTTTKNTTTTKNKTTKTSKKTNDVSSNNGFLLFCQEERDLLQDEHPKWSNTQLTKELAKAWSELKNDEQEEYNERAEGELVEEE